MENPKPFDIKEALSGKAVMLRNGQKAYVRHYETELDVHESQKLLGFLANGEIYSWCEDGMYLVSRQESNSDIIGMYSETRIINGFEVPAPETEELAYGTQYYVATPANKLLHSCTTWHDQSIEKLWLERGLIFLNAEDAIATANAMMGIDPNAADGKAASPCDG